MSTVVPQVPKLDFEFLSHNNQNNSESFDEHDESHSYGFDSSRSATSNDQYTRLYRLNTIRFQWKKIRCVGKGNSAEVFEAYRKDTGNIFALKELTAHVGSGMDLPSRSSRLRYLTNLYQREISIVRSLAHPHIIGYIGSEVSEDNEDDGVSTSIRMRIFMENCPSGTLRYQSSVKSSFTWHVTEHI
jgi:serine/threonine protein kinase